MLAAGASFSDGTLSIEFSEQMDVAEITEVNDIVLINGSPLDGVPGNQTIEIDDIESISIDGNGLTDARFIVGANFDSGVLQDIVFSDINEFIVNGNLDIANNIQGSFSGDDGFIAGARPVEIGGRLDLTTSENSDANFDLSLIHI